MLPKPDKTFTPLEQTLFAKLPLWDRLYRGMIYLKNEVRALAFTRFSGLLEFFANRARNEARRWVTDPDKLAELIQEYRIGCKRILISNDWYRAVNEPHVNLITGGITRFDETGVVSETGEHRPADVIIFGTGFRATEFLSPIHITGRNGVSLNEAWTNGSKAFKGITVAGFPNLFILYGPNTNLAHNSILYMLESQFRYVMSCLNSLQQQNALSMDVIPARQTEFVTRLQQNLEQSVWASGCNSWYTYASGKNVANWYGFTFSYRRLTKQVQVADYNYAQEGLFTQGPAIFISGAAAGIGRATAELFLKQGWYVGAFDINSEALSAFAEAENSEKLITGTLDVTQHSQWQ